MSLCAVVVSSHSQTAADEVRTSAIVVGLRAITQRDLEPPQCLT
jgi:hypothetical protein